MNLLEGKANEEYKIEKINLEDIIKTRLEVLGILKGTKIKMLNRRLNGEMIIKVRGTRLGIDKDIAKSIRCKKIKDNIKLEGQALRLPK